MTKILVIEDSADLRDDLMELLSLNEKYKTWGAENGRIGIQIAEEVHPDLILCDIMMPEMDGYKVLEHIRANSRTADIAFIFLTAKTEKLDRHHGMILGADDYIEKPYDVGLLLESIDAQLKKRSEQNAAARAKIEKIQESIITALPHELRTPLNTIIGFSEMLQSEAQYLKPDQIASWAGHVHTAGHRLFHLVENYLYYVRLQVAMQQNVDLEIREPMTNMRSAVEQQALTLAQKYKRQKDLVLELEPVDSLSIDYKDGLKIAEELIDNAFKFSETGQEVRICGKIENKSYIFSVTDKGRGLTPEQAKNIGGFVQFERWLHEQQGMGLGLIVVKLLADIYEAGFSIEGAENNGTTVTIQFNLT
jgi:two-component system, sensor histidine kinase and response regulator